LVSSIVFSGFVAPSLPSSISSSTVSIQSLMIYPIKSCHGFQITNSWPVSKTGLFLDREWALVDESGTHLALKRHAPLIRIKVTANLSTGNLIIESPSTQPLYVPITTDMSITPEVIESHEQELVICGDFVQ